MRFQVDCIFFDVDGVLVDSLPQHLQICRDKAAQFGLALNIPSPVEFRKMVARGTKVSPMYDFFVAVGFPSDVAHKAVEDYERDFAIYYRPKLFEGTVEALSRIHRLKIRLGLVTSNTRSNVLPILGSAASYFEPSCMFFFDDEAYPKSKAWFLAKGSAVMGVPPELCMYVGDQPADAKAAEESNFQFLGVTYGWGLLETDSKYDTINSIAEIPYRLQRTRYANRAG